MNKQIISNVMTFVMGAGVGVAASVFIMKKHYEEISKQEIESVKEVYAKKKEMEERDVDRKVAEKLIENNYYVTETNESVENSVDTEDEDTTDKLYLIRSDEVGDTDYITITLWYWTDGIVTNDNKKIIGNVEELIGDDFMAHFGDDEDDPDTVYVRNDVQKIDYEILKEYRGFSDYLEEQDA